MTRIFVNPQFAQCWTLDATGNWNGFRQDDDGSGWSLIQERTASPVNEITAITNTTGPAWATPAYDRNGNMTTIPRATGPSWSTLTGDGWGNLSASGWGTMNVDPAAFTATYDAWNRLVKLIDGEDIVQENEYDARNFRTVRKDYTSGTLSETRHFFYTDAWQDIEERLGSDIAPEEQNVWGIRYIDDLVLRDRTTENPLDERLYACQDANWNVTAIVSTEGEVQERYEYDPYGNVMFLTPDFTARPTSNFDWTTLFTGRYLDTNTLLCQFRFRYYSSFLGQWATRDPLKYRSSYNLYQYVNSRPLAALDPFGLVEPGAQPPCPGGPHQPGGPWEPGIPTRCTGDDTCAGLLEKIKATLYQLADHTGWDKEHPDPRWPQGRHASEIKDITSGLQRCFDIYEHKKCRKDNPKECKSNPNNGQQGGGGGAQPGGGPNCISQLNMCTKKADNRYAYCRGIMCEIIYGFELINCGNAANVCSEMQAAGAAAQLITDNPVEFAVGAATVVVVIAGAEILVPAALAGELTIPGGCAAAGMFAIP